VDPLTLLYKGFLLLIFFGLYRCPSVDVDVDAEKFGVQMEMTINRLIKTEKKAKLLGERTGTERATEKLRRSPPLAVPAAMRKQRRNVGERSKNLIN